MMIPVLQCGCEFKERTAESTVTGGVEGTARLAPSRVLRFLLHFRGEAETLCPCPPLRPAIEEQRRQ